MVRWKSRLVYKKVAETELVKYSKLLSSSIKLVFHQFYPRHKREIVNIIVLPPLILLHMANQINFLYYPEKKNTTKSGTDIICRKSSDYGFTKQLLASRSFAISSWIHSSHFILQLSSTTQPPAQLTDLLRNSFLHLVCAKSWNWVKMSNIISTIIIDSSARYHRTSCTSKYLL